MRHRSAHYAAPVTTTLALCTMFALAACGDDGTDASSTGSGSGGGSGGATAATVGSSTTTGPGSTSTATSTAATTSSTSDGGGTGQGGEGGAGGEAGDGGAGGEGSGGADVSFVPLWVDVAYPEDGGRVELEAFVGVTLQVRVAGTEDVVLELPDQTLPAGFIVHAYAVGLASDGTLDTFVVQDNDELEQPDPGDGNIRLAHFSPDVPAVDVYLLAENFDLYGPLLDTDSFDFPSMSRYGSFPAGEYEAMVVPTGGDPFGEAYAVVPGIEIVQGTSSTLALIGLDGEDDVDVVAYDDDLTTPEGGSGAVTFVHAVPDGPRIDVGALLPVE